MNFDQIPVWGDLSGNVQDTVLQVLIVVGVFIVLWLLRHLIAALLIRPLHYLADLTETDKDDILTDLLEGALSYFALGVAALLGALLFSLSNGMQSFLMTVAYTLFAIAIFRLFYEISLYVMRSPQRFCSVTKLDMQLELFPVMRISFKVLSYLVLLVILANIWSFNVTSLVAGVGLIGLAISLAAKEALDDVIGFAIIIGDNPFTLNEYIVSPHAEGIVERIGVRSTRVRQLNQGLVTVPNSQIANDWVTNWSRLEQRWFNFMLGVTYTSTADQIEALVSRIRDMLQDREHIKDDSIVVLFTDYEDSALGILVRCNVDIEDWTEAKAERHAVNLAIMRIVDELDMTIAFPSRSIYLEEVPVGLVGRDGDGATQELARTPSARVKTDDDGRRPQVARTAGYSSGAFSEGDHDLSEGGGDPRDDVNGDEGEDASD